MRFTSGATPTNLLAASMAAKPSLPHTYGALVGLETGSYHAAAHSVRSGRPDALPTELSRLVLGPKRFDLECNIYFLFKITERDKSNRFMQWHALLYA